MTHTTEQERALADLRHMYAQMVGGMVKDSAQAKRIADGILSRAIQKLEQAARRAPAVPVPQGWKLAPEIPTQSMCDAAKYQVHAGLSVFKWADGYSAMLAAAPQPPEAAQLDDTNVADMAQAVDSKEAAPVQMPEAEDGPSSCAYCGQPSDEPRKPLSDEQIAEACGWKAGLGCKPLPRELQIARAIEAAHGIKEQST